MNRDLFGDTEKSEYSQFVDKFKVKLTTDDCYTPPKVYDWILNYVKQQCYIADSVRVIRPFKPNGDYKNDDYSGDCVVVDNPPFSILAEIINFYNDNGVRYFLFAPHLTLFSSNAETTRIVAYCDITYENGAKIKTSFVSNLFGDYAVIADPNYRREVHRIQNADKPTLPRYKYPDNIVTVSRLAKIVEQGGEFKLKKGDVHRVSQLASQKRFKKNIFGSGYIISNKRAEELRAEELRAEENKRQREIVVWSLSSNEHYIIDNLYEKNLAEGVKLLF